MDYNGALIEIVNWEKYNPRKDLKASSWFRLQNTLFEDPNFIDFSDGELLSFLYLLMLCSKKQSGEVRLNLLHAERIGRRRPSDVISALEKLQELQVVRITPKDPYADVTQTLRGRDVDVPLRDETNVTNETKREVGFDAEQPSLLEREPEDRATPSPAVAGPSLLSDLWNELSGPLPKVRELSEGRRRAARSRLREKPDPEYWRDVIQRIVGSPFCRGENGRGWQANFDFLLRPDTHVKVMEGQYGCGSGSAANGIDWDAVFGRAAQ